MRGTAAAAAVALRCRRAGNAIASINCALKLSWRCCCRRLSLFCLAGPRGAGGRGGPGAVPQPSRGSSRPQRHWRHHGGGAGPGPGQRQRAGAVLLPTAAQSGERRGAAVGPGPALAARAADGETETEPQALLLCEGSSPARVF